MLHRAQSALCRALFATLLGLRPNNAGDFSNLKVLLRSTCYIIAQQNAAQYVLLSGIFVNLFALQRCALQVIYYTCRAQSALQSAYIACNMAAPQPYC